ncbi:hypothetical protein IAD21_04006 [Abditibacteriota bacterium]|nr:hypothetical protein IAD21_04006 [Abditibacteriota bacterium]
MTPSIARIFVLLASENDFALVIRRGPVNRVAALTWDRTRDTFKLGQWLKGRILEETCDLSPDGRHFLYQAKKYEPKVGYAAFYSVMSRAPYLTALHYWAPKHRVFGGAFFDNTRFWLSTFPIEARTLPHFAREKGVFELVETIAEYDVATYRRQRDGWVLQPDDYQRRNLWHKTLGEWTLARSMYNYNWRYNYPNLYELKHGTNEVISSDQWTWADFDIPRKRLCFARDGQLWALDLKVGAKETLLHDFNAMEFEPRVAPY